MTHLIFNSLDLPDHWRAWRAGDRVVLSRSGLTGVWEVGPDLEISYAKVSDTEVENTKVHPAHERKRLFRLWGLKPDLTDL